MQILPNQMNVPGSFQDSFNTGLQQLLQIKLGQMQQKQQARSFEKMGLPGLLSGVHPTVQKEYLRQNYLNKAINGLDTQQGVPQQQMLQQELTQSPQTLNSQPQDFSQQAMIQRALGGQMTPGQQMQLDTSSAVDLAPIPGEPVQFQAQPIQQQPGRRRTILDPDVIAKIATTDPKFALKLQQAANQKQRSIDSKFKKLTDSIESNRSVGNEIVASASKALEILRGGGVYSGIVGDKMPAFGYNRATADFVAAANDMVAQASKGSGPATAAKMKFLATAKPNLAYQNDANEDILLKYIEFGEGLRKEAEVSDQIKKANNGLTPENFDVLFHKNINNYIKDAAERSKKESHIRRKKDFKTMQDAPAHLFTGKQAYDDKTGKTYVSDGTNWIEKGD